MSLVGSMQPALALRRSAGVRFLEIVSAAEACDRAEEAPPVKCGSCNSETANWRSKRLSSSCQPRGRMSSIFSDGARSSLAFSEDAGCRSEVTPSGGALGGSLLSMSASSNTNSNANSDVVEIIDLRGTMRLSGNDPLLHRSPLSSGQTTPCSSSTCSSPEPQMQEAEMQERSPSPLSTALPNTTSPIAGGLPAKYASIPSATSPSLGFEMTTKFNEKDVDSTLTLSPSVSVTASQYHNHSKTDGVTRPSVSPTTPLSPTSISASSPSLFQQNMILNPVGLSSKVFLPPTTLPAAPIFSKHKEENEDEEDEQQICLWDNCGREFPSLSSLVSHLDREHTLSMMKYICFWKHCQRNLKPFDARYKLITHLRCHTGEKPYRCEVINCKRSFSRLENLKLHIRTHTGEKPYVCHYEGCDKRFNNTSDRAKHMKTHVTRKPYACKFPGCGKSYTDPSSMRKHVKYTHRMRERLTLEEECNGLISINKSPRKSSSTSSSSAPSTPRSSPGVMIPSTAFAINVTSPVGTTFPSLPRAIQTVQSPPPSTVSQATNLTVAGVMTSLTPTPTPTPTPLVSMPIFQLPAAQMPTFGGTQQQPVVMVLSAANKGGQISPQKVDALQQGVQPTAISLAVNGSTQLLPKLQPQTQENGRQTDGGESTDSTLVEKHLRMQITHLQQQLALSQQQNGCNGNSSVAVNNGQLCSESNLKGGSPSKAAPPTPPVVKLIPNASTLSQGATQPLPQIQLPTMQSSLAAVNHVIPTQFPQYIPISNLTNGKPLTVLNSSPILGLSPTGGQTLLPQLVVPGAQVIPIVQSQGVTPQILYVAPNSQTHPHNSKT